MEISGLEILIAHGRLEKRIVVVKGSWYGLPGSHRMAVASASFPRTTLVLRGWGRCHPLSHPVQGGRGEQHG